MKIPFAGQGYKAKYPSLNGQRCVNWYPVIDNAQGKTTVALYPTPGYGLFTNGSGNEGRGCFEWKGIGYKVVDSTFYEVTSGGTETSKGTLLTFTGRVKFIANPTQIMVIDGTYGYVYTIATGSFAQITDPDFPTNPISMDYQDGFGFIVAQHADGTYRLYFSNVNDFTAWTATDVVTPTYKADNTKAVVSNKEVLHVLSELSSEIYINNDGTIERQPRSSMNYGIDAVDSALQIDESVIFLAKDKFGAKYVVKMTSAPEIAPISDAAVTYAINSYLTTSDAFAWGINWEDHMWYVLTFPTQNVTWVYDLVTKSWFEWASLSSAVNASATPGRHTANGYMFLNNKHIICDYESGKLFQIKNFKYTDSPAETATIMLQTSKSKGSIWGAERWKRITIGKYLKRMIWAGLGTARDWMFRLKFADTINTENSRTVIRTRETAHFASEDNYLSISNLRIDIGIEPAPFVILDAFANGAVSGIDNNDNKQQAA